MKEDGRKIREQNPGVFITWKEVVDIIDYMELRIGLPNFDPIIPVCEAVAKLTKMNAHAIISPIMNGRGGTMRK